MRIAVTGADGFLGWHLRCLAHARGIDCLSIGRAALDDPQSVGAALVDVDAVIHCAGVNRGSATDVRTGNVAAAEALAKALVECGREIRVVYANSVQARLDNPYGAAKRAAAKRLTIAGEGFSDVLLPNLFGEHGRPHYNSFVATFCDDVVAGRTPRVVDDREVPLLHAQDAAAALLAEVDGAGTVQRAPDGVPISISTVGDLLEAFEAVYRHGELPELRDRFVVRLFNTYRSYLVSARFPIHAEPRSDPRGSLVECVRTPASGGQAFVSSTLPGAVRGEHYHLRKLERFVVVDGDAMIRLRRLFTRDVVELRVSGAQPTIIDMPTGWVHNLRNVGDRPVTTFFWTNELFDPGDPDTFGCPVDPIGAPA